MASYELYFVIVSCYMYNPNCDICYLDLNININIY